MAVNIRQLFPLQQAKLRRSQLARYVKLDGGRYLIAAALILAMLSLLSLGQTGRLATQGYELANMQAEHTELQRQHSALQLRLSEAQSFLKIEGRAAALKLQSMAPEQARYITIAPADAVPTPVATEQP